MAIEKKKTDRRVRVSAERFEVLADQVRSADGSRLATSDLAGSIGFLLRLANGVVAGDLGAQFEALGLRQSLFSVLLIIKENPGLKQQEVGQILSIQQPNLVALINELVSDGLITRTVNADDRRSYSLNLTVAGKGRLAKANALHEKNERRLAESLGPVSPADFRAALIGILENSRANALREE